MTSTRTPAASLSPTSPADSARPATSRPAASRRLLPFPALSVSLLPLLAMLALSGCGSAENPPPSAGGSSAVPSRAAAAPADAKDEDAAGEAPTACSLLSVDVIKSVTGRTYSAGKGTDYDNTCRYNTASDTVTVAISDRSNLESARPIGKDVAAVPGLAGATRVDAVVYVEVEGWHLSVATGLPGFFAPERDAKAAEELAKLAVARF